MTSSLSSLSLLPWLGDIGVKIEIRFYHGLNKYLPPGDGEYTRRLDVPSGATAEWVLADLGVPKRETLVLFLNGQVIGGDHALEPGDVLTAMLPAGGG